MTRARMSGSELARASGVNVATISLLLKGKRRLGIQHAAAMAQHLGVEPAALLPDPAVLDQLARSPALAPTPVSRAATASPTGVSDPRAEDRRTVAAYIEAHAQDLTPRETRFLQTMGARTVDKAPLSAAVLDVALEAFRDSMRG